MFHFHHVCVRGGSDGIYVGMHGIENDWSHMANKKNRIMLPGEWHKFSRQKSLIPMFIHRLQYKGHVNLTMKHGSTLFMNCYHQHQKGVLMIHIHTHTHTHAYIYSPRKRDIDFNIDEFTNLCTASNPAHFMMKMGVWYETALCQSNNNFKNIFANDVQMPFKHGNHLYVNAQLYYH